MILLTRGALAEMRSLLLELRPHTIEDAHLEDLLKQLSEAAAGRIRKPVKFECHGNAILPSDVRFAFYRIAQEALNNIYKHSEANNVSIELNYENDQASILCRFAKLVIHDDGRGFGSASINSNHLGFEIMKERAQSIGADLIINSQLKKGTTVELIWKRLS